MLNKAKDLAKNLTLSDIHLLEDNCSRCMGFPPENSEVSVDVNSGILQTEEENIFPFGIKFTVKAIDNESDLMAFQIDVKFAVVYRAKEDIEPTKESIEAFGLTSAVFNAWPYAREYVQNILARMKLPQFAIPPITIAQLAKMREKPDDNK